MELAELLSRIEAATGPDRELDADLFEVLEAPHRAFVCARQEFIDSGMWDYTSSVDAALALVERVFPGVLWEIQSAPHRLGFRAALWGKGAAMVSVDGRTPPTAILAALVRALLAKEQS